jgi:16S rRNA processing protein RimM
VSERICVAQFGAAHGVRGELRLRSFTEDPADFAAYGPLESEDRRQTFKIVDARAAKDHFIVRIAGIEDRDAAQTLCNVRLYVARSQLPAPDDADTFYHTDLVGLPAVTPDGDVLGTVAAIYNFGAGDVIEIAPAQGEPLLVPFTEQAVPTIDFTAKRIVVVPPGSSE